ncbi:MAG: hypothetical protein CVV51_04790 [Spirochaetae bacterium HGW-Spirochaetae-7]|nr:MAG: hypothetical protein CVV51_04790 [Spirochaetae bacterium HGW-Spirochaetae-7]
MVLATAVSAGVRGVEWTDDGFLAPGDVAAAQEAMVATLRAGLCTVSFATQYRACLHDRTAFALALATAHGLNAPTLRLWSAPRGGSPACDADAFVDEARSLGDEAGGLGVTLCFGLAADSVLDSCEAASVLLARIDHPFVKLAWSPEPNASFDDSMEAIASVAGRIGMFVVRSGDLGDHGGKTSDRAEEWLQYLDAYDEQGDNPDMARHVVIRSIDGGNPADLASCVSSIDGWSADLRRYHKRRVY